MPIYCYCCLDCGSWDQRVAGLDDEADICANCGGLMLRVADNIQGPYFEEISDVPEEIFQQRDSEPEETMVPQEEAIRKISLELSQIYRKNFGRDPDSELIRDEAENIVEKFGPVMAIKEIFSRDKKSVAPGRSH